MRIRYPYKEITQTKEQLHSFTYTFVLKPVIILLTFLFANFTRLRPNEITVLSIVPYIISGYFFYSGYFILGAVFFPLAFLLDCVDGRIARLKGQGSKFGAFFDNYVGLWGYIIMFIGYFYGLSLAKDNQFWLVLGLFTYFVFRLHGRTSLHVKSLLGNGYSSKVKSKHKNMGAKSAIWRVPSLAVSYMAKKGATEPFHLTDIEFLVFFIAPIIETFYSGVIFAVLVASIAILLAKEVFWFTYYRRILKEA